MSNIESKSTHADDKAKPEVGMTWNSADGVRKIVAIKDDKALIVSPSSPYPVMVPLDRLDNERAFDEKQAEFAKAKKASVDADAAAKAKQKADDEADHGFTEGMLPIKAGKVLATLNAKVSWSGTFDTRKAHIERRVRAGWRVSANGRFESPEGVFYADKDITATGKDYAAFLVKVLKLKSND